MAGWKKIASLFALSTSLGILGVACNAPVEEVNEPSDTADVADEAQALDGQEDQASESSSALRPIGRPGRPVDHVRGRDSDRIDREHDRLQRERCIDRCDIGFRTCMREHGRFGDRERRERCDRRQRDCRHDCVTRRF
ncbi:MAG: hypothetical protein QM820_07885 [Minicystis sp.]